MRIDSTSFADRQPIPAEFAAGARGGEQGFGGNKNPHLAWHDVPDATRAFAVLCIDVDVPTNPALVADSSTPIPVDHPRGEFVHWVVANIPSHVREIAAGSCSAGFTVGGKPAGEDAGGVRGINDYTHWFAGDAAMGGQYFGYDGPYPPAHDLRMHRYFFRVFALDVDTLELPAVFTAADVFRAMHGHVLAEAAMHGTYSLNG